MTPLHCRVRRPNQRASIELHARGGGICGGGCGDAGIGAGGGAGGAGCGAGTGAGGTSAGGGTCAIDDSKYHCNSSILCMAHLAAVLVCISTQDVCRSPERMKNESLFTGATYIAMEIKPLAQRARRNGILIEGAAESASDVSIDLVAALDPDKTTAMPKRKRKATSPETHATIISRGADLMSESALRHVRSTSKKNERAKNAAAADPLEQLLAAMTAVGNGDFSVQLPGHWDGLAGRLAESYNTIVSHNRRLANDLALIGEKVGRMGQVRHRLTPTNRQASWADMEQSINGLIDDLVRPVETMTEAMAGVAKGDLTRSVPLEADGRPLAGEFLRSA